MKALHRANYDKNVKQPFEDLTSEEMEGMTTVTEHDLTVTENMQHRDFGS